MRAPATLVLVGALAVLVAGCDTMQARSLVKQGNSLYRAGKFEEALARYQAAARLEPDFPTLQLNLGYAALAAASAHRPPDSDRYAQTAAEAFSRYMQLRPRDERGSKFYLQSLLDASLLDRALRFLEEQHRRNPADVKIVASLGLVSSRAGRFEAALGWYEERARLLPREEGARYLIGTLCWERLYRNGAIVGAERVRVADRGIAALQAALALRASYPEALTYLNLLYRERALGQSDPRAREADLAEARRHYERALALSKQPAAR